MRYELNTTTNELYRINEEKLEATKYLYGYFVATPAATALLRQQGIYAGWREDVTGHHQQVAAGEEGDLFYSCYAVGDFVLLREGDLRTPNFYGLGSELTPCCGKFEGIFDNKVYPKKVADEQIENLKRYDPEQWEFYTLPLFEGGVQIYYKGEI